MNRPKTEFDYVMKLFEREARKLVDDKYINEKKVKVNFIGNLHLLPEGVQSAFKEAMEATKDHDRFELNIAIAYGGREDLIDAIKTISEKIKNGEINPEDINEDLIMNSLALSEDIDYVIRTSGEHRTSGFFIWQSAYAEYCFVDKFFPAFEKEDFVKAIESFGNREQRLGK